MKHRKAGGLVTIFLVLAAGISLLGCQAKAELPNKTVNTVETEAPAPTLSIAMITDIGGIDDQSICQGTWQGVEQFATAHDTPTAYYVPTEASMAARSAAIDAAVAEGATTIVCPGDAFGEVVYAAQETYPEVEFLVVGSQPTDASGDFVPAETVHSILYQEEQVGYLAGYALVSEGYYDLGFAGAWETASVMRYGYGFQQGIDDAAEELGVTNDIYLTYWYANSSDASDAIQTEVAHWYQTGTTAVFSCGGSIHESVITAAEPTSGKVVGAIVDQSARADSVITSATIDLSGSTNDALEALFENNGTWPESLAGASSTLGTAQDSLGLVIADDSWKLTTFTVEAYKALYEKVKMGDITISSATDTKPSVAIEVRYKNEPL